MKMNVEFENIQEFEVFVEYFSKKLLKQKDFEEQSVKQIVEKETKKQKLLSEMREFVNTPAIKNVFKEAKASVGLDKNQTQEDCHLLYPDCGYPNKRHYHVKRKKKIPVYTDKKEKYVGPVTLPND